jgi:hypothetical protein
LRERDEARAHGLIVDQYGARAAFPFAASLLRSRERALLANDVEQTRHWVRVDVRRDAV